MIDEREWRREEKKYEEGEENPNIQFEVTSCRLGSVSFFQFLTLGTSIA